MISIFKLSLKILEENLNHKLFFENYSPILYFGQISQSKIATLGINPSNIEFQNFDQSEISGNKRRFESLSSLNLCTWRDFKLENWGKVESSFSNYFNHNPYNLWFKKLDQLFQYTPYSYYFPYNNICHLDLIPFASREKWSNLDLNLRKTILHDSKDILFNIIKESNISFLLLNGRTVVNQFQSLYGDLYCKREESLDLFNKNSIIKGYLFEGQVEIGNKKINVIGYNHNIQSTFGINKQVVENLKSIIKTRVENNV